MKERDFILRALRADPLPTQPTTNPRAAGDEALRNDRIAEAFADMAALLGTTYGRDETLAMLNEAIARSHRDDGHPIDHLQAVIDERHPK